MMKKTVASLILFLSLSFYVNAQSENYCIHSEPITIDSWARWIYYDAPVLPRDMVQINVTTTFTGGGGSSSTGWLPFTSGMSIPGTGLGVISVVEIRWVNPVTNVVTAQFVITRSC